MTPICLPRIAILRVAALCLAMLLSASIQLASQAEPAANASASEQSAAAPDAAASKPSSADQTQAAAPTDSTQAPAAPSGPPDWHRIRMRVSGSMCASCLKDLDRDMHKVKGVWDLKVVKPPTNIMLDISPDMEDFAEGVVVIDANTLSLDALKEAFKSSGYNMYHIVEKQLGREPDSKDLKL